MGWVARVFASAVVRKIAYTVTGVALALLGAWVNK